jgi:hypothetical protein
MKKFVGAILMLTAAMVAGPEQSRSQDIRLYVPQDSIVAGEAFAISVVARYPDHVSLRIPHADGEEPARFGDFVLIALESRDRRVVGNQVTRQPGLPGRCIPS